jgi:superfamily II DNA helicase RecQ
VLHHQFPSVPILAVTATATPEIVDDVSRLVGMRRPALWRGPVDRENLRYEARPAPANQRTRAPRSASVRIKQKTRRAAPSTNARASPGLLFNQPTNERPALPPLRFVRI